MNLNNYVLVPEIEKGRCTGCVFLIDKEDGYGCPKRDGCDEDPGYIWIEYVIKDKEDDVELE
jgi:hypothetical protein